MWHNSINPCYRQCEWNQIGQTSPSHCSSQMSRIFQTVPCKSLSAYAKVFLRIISSSELTLTPAPDKTPEERGKLLASTDLFTKVHLDSSALGQTPQPTSEEDGMNTDLHFTCFIAAPDGQVRKAAAERQHTLAIEEESSTAPASTSGSLAPATGDIVKATSPDRQLVASGTTPAEGQLEGMRLLELDGRRPFPVDHGPCVDVLDVCVVFVLRIPKPITHTYARM